MFFREFVGDNRTEMFGFHPLLVYKLSQLFCRFSDFQAGNVQCFACDRAFHGNCRPKSGVLINPKDPLSNWFCPDCEHLANVEFRFGFIIYFVKLD